MMYWFTVMTWLDGVPFKYYPEVRPVNEASYLIWEGAHNSIGNCMIKKEYLLDRMYI